MPKNKHFFLFFLLFLYLFLSSLYANTNEKFLLIVATKMNQNFRIEEKNNSLELKGHGLLRHVSLNKCSTRMVAPFKKKIADNFEQYQSIKGAGHVLTSKLYKREKSVLIQSSFGKYLEQLPKKFLLLEKKVWHKCRKSS